MASTMASTTALSRPSEKLGTHSTRVDITGKNKGENTWDAKEAFCEISKRSERSLPSSLLLSREYTRITRILLGFAQFAFICGWLFGGLLIDLTIAISRSARDFTK